MDCSEAVSLVEKLVDGEATPRERYEAEEHIEGCKQCRAYREFLDRVATAAKTVKLGSPSDGYWNSLPGKVMDRIDTDTSHRAFMSAGALRWVALAATMVVAIAVGVYFASHGELGPPPGEHEPPEASETSVADSVGAAVPGEAEAAGETAARGEVSAPPPMVRDEAASPETVASLDREVERVGRAAESPAEPSAEANAEEMEMPVASQPLLVAESDVGRASRARQTRDCGSLRDRLRELDGPDLTEGHYQLAVCSLERYEAERTPELREIAVRDAESFLAVEAESPRASTLREALTRIQ